MARIAGELKIKKTIQLEFNTHPQKLSRKKSSRHQEAVHVLNSMFLTIVESPCNAISSKKWSEYCTCKECEEEVNRKGDLTKLQ